MNKSDAIIEANVILEFLNDEIQSVQNHLLQERYDDIISRLEYLIKWIENQPE